MDSLQAAILRVKLKHLEVWTHGRRHNANKYNELFHSLSIPLEKLSTPTLIRERHIFNQYVIRVERRDELLNYLKAQEVGAEVYYPVPMHLQECFAYLGHKAGDFPESEKAARETMAIPIYPELSSDQARHAVETIARFYSV